MKKILLMVLFSISLLFFSSKAFSNDIYYAKCNLKVIKGVHITWVNWQSTPTFIPAGTELKVQFLGNKAELENKSKGKKYLLDLGASGEQYLEKFVSREPVSIKEFSKGVQKDIKKTIATVGMTKKEAYIAMGPPATADGVKTNTMTYEEIMETDLWIYKRRRFGKNIGVSFDYDTGRVDRTEGIWRR